MILEDLTTTILRASLAQGTSLKPRDGGRWRGRKGQEARGLRIRMILADDRYVPPPRERMQLDSLQ